MTSDQDVPESALVPIPNHVVAPATAFMHSRTVSSGVTIDELTKGEPCLYGSGVLLQVADTKFVATAHHVCEMFLQDGWSAFVGGGAEKLLPIDRASIRPSKKADVALLKLSENVWSAFLSEKQFARLSEVSADDWRPSLAHCSQRCGHGRAWSRKTSCSASSLPFSVGQVLGRGFSPSTVPSGSSSPACGRGGQIPKRSCAMRP